MQFRRLRRALRTRVSTVPWLYLPMRRMNRYSEQILSRATELMIEGYPRSGNVFCATAFRLSQKRPVKLAYRTHAAAHVIAACRRQVPCLVLIRNPVDAARSLMMTDRKLFDPQTALSEYILFYRALLPWRERFVLARFESVTTDFGQAIGALNERFATDFDLFEHTDENSKRVFDEIDERVRSKRGGKHVDYSPTADPGWRSAREFEKERVRAEFDAPELDRINEEALSLYRQFHASADV